MALHESEEILSIDQNYTPLTEHSKSGDEVLVSNIIKVRNKTSRVVPQFTTQRNEQRR